MYLSISKKILAWYTKYQRDLPWRKFTSKKDKYYKVLLSEFMLQQTQVKTAIPYFNNFYKKINTIDKLAKSSQSKVNKLWQGLGYYRRAKFLLTTSKIIKNKFNSNIPQNYNDLVNLPGIGDYTAKAILSIAFDKSEIGIDGNVERVASRVFLSKNKKKIFQNVEKLKVKKNSSFLMQGLMELGALICKPKKPLCDECCIKNNCKFFLKNKKVVYQKLHYSKKNKKFIACIYIHKKKILLRHENNLGPLKGFLNVPLFDNTNINLKKKLNEIFKQNVSYSLIGKMKISISNFNAEIMLIKIKNLNKINYNFKFYNKDNLKKEFESSFLDKILTRVKFKK